MSDEGSPREQPTNQPQGQAIPIIELLEELNVAAALVDCSGRIVAMTERLRELEEFSDCHPGSPPRHWDSTAEARIKAYLQSVIAEKGSPVPLVVDGRRRRPLVVKAIPIRQRPLKGASAAEAVVVVIDLQVNPAPSPELLRYIFDFTRAEARLASSLAAGESLSQAARSLQISLGTARQQLKAIFAKTGCRRQSELLSLLGRLTALKPIDEALTAGLGRAARRNRQS